MDICNLDEVRRAMQPNTSLVWIESPTNPRMQVTDIGAREHIEPQTLTEP